MTGPLWMACALAAMVLWCAGWQQRSLAWRRAVMVLVLVASLLPWPLGLAHWLESFFAQLSITSGLLAVSLLLRVNGLPSLVPATELRVLAWLLVAVAIPFYPLSLGAAPLDPYAWGFGDFRFSTALLLLGLAAWVARYYALCLLLVLAEVAYHFQLLHSDNLWDYLMDPLLVIYAVVVLCRRPAASSASEAGTGG